MVSERGAEQRLDCPDPRLGAVIVSADLLPPSQPLEPVFPSTQRGNQVALFEGGEGGVCVYWRVTNTDVVRLGSGLPNADAQFQVVLRLLRLGPESQSAQIQQWPLPLQGSSGQGVTSFQDAESGHRYRAELGVIDDRNGWLLLRRSNALDHAAAILPPEDLASLAARRQAGRSDGWRDRPSEVAVALSPRSPRLQRIAPPSQRYGVQSAPTGKLALGVVAELRIQGWGPPNTDIDLFGHPYRIGPGGRFQMTVAIDDPKLLEDALRQHPPAALSNARED